MPLSLRWVGQSEYDALAEVRARCYAPAAKDVAVFKERLLSDQRAKPGDHLLAERDGRIVGTATSLSMTMWVRGGSVPCQGVAFVGTIKTARRGGSKSAGERGIASQIMFEALRLARERQQVVSALMPFRASFYEHFGYGLAEQRAEWIVPLSILPPGDFGGIRYREPV
jgi:predicted acetyltransferase